MTRFILLNVPTVWIGIGSVMVAVVLSLLGLVLVHRNVELSTLESHKEVAGFIIAVIGVIYAVLLAFVVVIVWEEYNSAESNAWNEAVVVGNLYRDAVALGPAGRPLRGALRRYVISVVNDEWPSIAARQEESPKTTVALNALWSSAERLRVRGATGKEFVSAVVRDLATASEDRRTRILNSAARIPAPLWVVLLAGAVITVGFTYFFGLERFSAQALMVSALAAIIALSLFVILVLDLPFTGQVAVKPSAMRSQLMEFSSLRY